MFLEKISRVSLFEYVPNIISIRKLKIWPYFKLICSFRPYKGGVCDLSWFSSNFLKPNPQIGHMYLFHTLDDQNKMNSITKLMVLQRLFWLRFVLDFWWLMPKGGEFVWATFGWLIYLIYSLMSDFTFSCMSHSYA